MRELYEPFVRTGQPDPGHGPRLGRAHEVRGQRHARHPHLVHERDREPCDQVGADVRQVRHAASARDSRIGAVVPVPRRRLRRLLLPEGRQGPPPDGQGGRAAACAWWRRWTRPTTRRRRILVPADRGAPRAGSRARSIALWGLAFKPATDDMREAPALADHRGPPGRRAPRCGPTTPRRWHEARAGPRRPRHAAAARSYEAVEGADALVVVTEWNEFREPDFARIKTLDAAPGDLRRPQHLRPASTRASWASTTRGSAGGDHGRSSRGARRSRTRSSPW